MSKKCIKCDLTKDLEDFPTRNVNGKIKYLGNCRLCENERIKIWRQNKAKEKKKEKLAEVGITEDIPEGYKHCTKCLGIKPLEEFGERIKLTGVFPRSWCKECERIAKRDYDRNNGVKPKKTTRKCRYCKLEYPTKELSKTYYCVNCRDDEVQEGFKRCTFCKEIKELEEFRYKTYKNCNPFPRSNCKVCEKLIDAPRRRINDALKIKSLVKTMHTIDLIGCSWNYLKNWLEWQFDSHMDWNNMGSYWHIDHVTPCSSFNLYGESEQLTCFNWRNMRPLEAKRNISKSNKIIPKDILHQELKVRYYESTL